MESIETLARSPEFETVEDFVQYCMDDEKEDFSHTELNALALSLKLSSSKVRVLLQSYGLTLVQRKIQKNTRGFTSNSHNRFAGNPNASGSGWQQIQGFAG